MIVLGLGSNMGDRLGNLRAAVRSLRADPEVQVLRASPVYESDPLLPADFDSKARDLQEAGKWSCSYLNMALACNTSLPPTELLRKVKKIERELGRESAERWAPRPIDIDLLCYGDLVLESAGNEWAAPLTVPHTALMQRPFALFPLHDVYPEWKHPVTGEVLREVVSSLRHRREILLHTKRYPALLTELMGIINVTPDSFSDGGKFESAESALAQAEALVNGGASVLDIGAESTRPGARELAWDEEWLRLEPVLKAIMEDGVSKRARISVDTRHPRTAAKALALGVHWINDVSGGSDPTMLDILRQSGADYVFMHSETIPASRVVLLNPDVDPVEYLVNWANQKVRHFMEMGMPPQRLVLDPGIGFGKNPLQSLEILRRAAEFQRIGVRVLMGHSRKSFMNEWVKEPPAIRDLETAVISGDLALHGVDYLRVHDTAANSRALRAKAQVATYTSFVSE